jgi:hypothetical protein
MKNVTLQDAKDHICVRGYDGPETLEQGYQAAMAMASVLQAEALLRIADALEKLANAGSTVLTNEGPARSWPKQPERSEK